MVLRLDHALRSSHGVPPVALCPLILACDRTRVNRAARCMLAPPGAVDRVLEHRLPNPGLSDSSPVHVKRRVRGGAEGRRDNMNVIDQFLPLRFFAPLRTLRLKEERCQPPNSGSWAACVVAKMNDGAGLFRPLPPFSPYLDFRTRTTQLTVGGL